MRKRLTKKQTEKINLRKKINQEVKRRVEEELERRKGEEEYSQMCNDRISRGLCGRCGSFRCVCE
jgi:hypothetical protein